MSKKEKDTPAAKQKFNRKFIFMSLACIGVAAIAALFCVALFAPEDTPLEPYAFLDSKYTGMEVSVSEPKPQKENSNLNYYVVNADVGEPVKFILFEEKTTNLFGQERTELKDTYSQGIVAHLKDALGEDASVEAETVDSEEVQEKAKQVGQTIYSQLVNYGIDMAEIGPTIDFTLDVTIAGKEYSEETVFCAYNYTNDTIEVATVASQLGDVSEIFVPENICGEANLTYENLDEINDDDALENPIQAQKEEALAEIDDSASKVLDLTSSATETETSPQEQEQG